MLNQGKPDRGAVRPPRRFRVMVRPAGLVGAIRAGQEVGFKATLARSVVRIVEAVDFSPLQGGREAGPDHGDLGEQPTCAAS